MEGLLMKFGCTAGQAAARARSIPGFWFTKCWCLQLGFFWLSTRPDGSTAWVITSAWPFAACWTIPTKEGEAAAPARTSTHKAKGGTTWNRPKQAA